jgi:5-(carboxyamino)imidazole ribonucleotide mutase
MKERIGIVLGSKSDLEELKSGFDLLKEFNIPHSVDVISAHRHPDALRQYCLDIPKQKIQVVIACAGMAAALPGFIASYSDVPVIGVAMRGGLLDGLDAVLSMISIPRGLGLVASGVGKNAFINAVIVALEIFSLKDKSYVSVLAQVKKKFKQ